MAKELAFALINPYTLRKSRTGGVISRLIMRTGLDLVAARIFCPNQELATRYATMLRGDDDVEPGTRDILADYVLRAYSPDPKTGRGHRVMMLLFEGEDAIRKVAHAAGSLTQCMGSGETVRDTYGDYVVNDLGQLIYVEPAVLIGPTRASVKRALSLWCEFTDSCGGLADFSGDIFADPSRVQKTLVLIKPDNFRFPSSRPGNIIDIFSRAALRIIGVQVHRMSVAEALDFYGPVQKVLQEKFRDKAADVGCKALGEALGFALPPQIHDLLSEKLGPLYGDIQFYRIVQFMTGLWVPDIKKADYANEGGQRCLAIVYKGEDAVSKIRSILGPTDPTKAEPGSVRREYGQDIMVNAAHASDSPENAEREMNILKLGRDKIRQWYEKHYA
ncbi:MAG: nucleoside-diphosphate kinase [Verrucomicrobiae bacterium]|nr:nucleoside-diphosphate kinase [Verrucomicrobiae bacterium]